MRCHDVQRALFTPDDGLDRSAVALHVADCPQCAALDAAAQRLDHAWGATRPAEPGPGAFDLLWAEVLRRESQPDVLSFVSDRSRRPWLVPVLIATVVAQAAAVMVAVGLAWRGPTPIVVAAAPAAIALELEPGQTMILRLEERGNAIVLNPRVIDMTEELVAFDGDSDPAFGDPGNLDFVVLNAMEGFAQ